MIGLDFMLACAPNVAPETTQQIIAVESHGNPIAVNVNGAGLKVHPKDAVDAAGIARSYIAKGYSVDLGLMQINSRNLDKFGYSVEDMFEPCKNIAAGARVLSSFYSAALRTEPDRQMALRAALSAYNTGNFERGFFNGYLARYGVNGVGASRTPVRVPSLSQYAADTAVFIRTLKMQKENAMSKPETQIYELPTATRIRTVPVVSHAAEDAATPGVMVEHSPEDAQSLGAFVETAISHQEAWIANEHIDQDDTAIVVGGKVIADVSAGSGAHR